CMQAIQFPLTF
nr:immunoglobulin light chain junction region [Macaca mulatta]